MSEIDVGLFTVLLAATPTTKGAATSFKTSTYGTAEDVAANAPFDFVLPGEPLAGHRLLDGALITTPAPAAALTYVEEKSGRHYILVQSPMSAGEPGEKPTVHAIGEEIKPATVGGHSAALVMGSAPGSTPRPMTLMWSRNELLLQVTGLGYDLSDLQSIADALA